MSNLNDGLIKSTVPHAGVEGGEVVITCEGYDTSDYLYCHVWFGDQRGRVISAAPNRVVITVPDCDTGIEAHELKLESSSGVMATPFTLGVKLAENLHPVANPAVDRDDGSIYVTLSGTRSQKMPVSIYKISPEDELLPMVTDLVNPTGLAFSREGTLYVTSRYDGKLFRISPFGEPETVASDLGVATGLAFDRRGDIYVGDRTGTIFRVNELGEVRQFAELDPSVAAYHLAFSPDGDLYVSGPTVSSFETIWRIDAMGEVEKFYTGLGRPQGLAFDVDGNLYVAASLKGHRGIVRITPDGGNAEVVVAGASLVGLAFDGQGNMIVVSTSKVYRVPMGIKGYSVF
ncbi:MAG TPA: SMP-30/gluconolactonase/LRE family protein [Blastocatellia bacterium]|nr:SMP-30/gluconolactonase/LRE family protein [Blastocatellia bacterium]